MRRGRKCDPVVQAVFCWIFSILTWAFLIIFIYTFVTKNKIVFLYPFIGCYVIYFILQLSSTTGSYLCQKKSAQNVYDKLGSLFATAPEMRFSCKCYHYEMRAHYVTGSGFSRRNYRRRRTRIVTHRDAFRFPYYSGRDVSGLFYLNCNEADIKKKVYIQLQLSEEINFADSISYYDYMYYKNEFWSANRFLDYYMDFIEIRRVPGLIHFNLIKLHDDEPFYANYFFFMLFTILTLADFYKILFNSICVFQSFTIRKIVSTRYDLNEPVYQQKYLPLVPQLNLIDKQYTYESKNYTYINDEVKVKTPTIEELNEAEQYENKVPNYKISNGSGNFHEGVIENGILSEDYNQPPPQFAGYGENVAIQEWQIVNKENNQKNSNENTKRNPGSFSNLQNGINQGQPNSNQQINNQGYYNYNQQINNQGYYNYNQQIYNQGYYNYNQQGGEQIYSNYNNPYIYAQNQGFSNYNYQGPPTVQVINANSELRGLKNK